MILSTISGSDRLPVLCWYRAGSVGSNQNNDRRRETVMNRFLSRTALIVFLILCADLACANDSSFYAARRSALMKKIEGSAAILEGAPDTRAYIPFRQDNDFYYLTGVETPNALLMLDASQHRSILFLPLRDAETAKWEGPGLAPGPDAQSKTGMDEVMELSKFAEELEKRKGRIQALYTPFSPLETAATSRDRALVHESARRADPWDGRQSREGAFENNLRAKLGGSVSLKDLSVILDEMRRVKDAREIEYLREAARIGALGLKEAIRSTRPGMYEYQLAALAEFVFLWHGAQGYAFFPIVGSGPNSCILHYHKNRRRMLNGDIVVMDFGADYLYYQSDITRTFPVSGRFSEDQARVYVIVLEAQKAALEKVRPGATFDSIGDAAREVLGHYDYAAYLTHGVSHYIGMSTHDVGESKPFEPGVVISVEPGVYLPEENLGVRIEDMVLVTENGCEVLSKDVPKEIGEIEELMSEKGITSAIKE